MTFDLYTTPFEKAWQRMIDVLFRGATVKFWLLMGFSAWLASLGEGGGCGCHAARFFQDDLVQHLPDGSQRPEDFLNNEVLMRLAAIFGIIILLAIVIGFVITYIRARGEFMFLQNAVNGTCLVRQAWRQSARPGVSLFMWMIGFGLVVLVVLILLVGLLVAAVWPSIQSRSVQPVSILGSVLVFVLMLVVIILSAYISTFLIDFVVPLMARFQLGSMAAWSHFMQLFKLNVGLFIGYGIAKWLILMVAGFVIQILTLVTCCLAGLPYIGAVLTLPVLLFLRYYSLEFLRQFSADYDLFPPPPEELSEPTDPHGLTL